MPTLPTLYIAGKLECLRLDLPLIFAVTLLTTQTLRITQCFVVMGVHPIIMTQTHTHTLRFIDATLYRHYTL